MTTLLAILLAKAAQETTTEMDDNLIWQYTAVGAVFIGLAIWLLIKTIRQARSPRKGGGCCGCSLAETCNSRKLKEGR